MKKFQEVADSQGKGSTMSSKEEGQKSIMKSKEGMHIVKTYNKVARALIEFETLWHQASCPCVAIDRSLGRSVDR